MSSKRRADKQITADDPASDAEDEDEEAVVGGTWQRASAEELAKRKIVKLKRWVHQPFGTSQQRHEAGTPALGIGPTQLRLMTMVLQGHSYRWHQESQYLVNAPSRHASNRPDPSHYCHS